MLSAGLTINRRPEVRAPGCSIKVEDSSGIQALLMGPSIAVTPHPHSQPACFSWSLPLLRAEAGATSYDCNMALWSSSVRSHQNSSRLPVSLFSFLLRDQSPHVGCFFCLGHPAAMRRGEGNLVPAARPPYPRPAGVTMSLTKHL